MANTKGNTVKLKLPFLITLTSMLLGVFIAILFGINEDIFKGRIKAELESNPKVMKMSGAKKTAYVAKEASKNWRYYQRFHFHSTGIAAMSLGILLLISLLSAPAGLKLIASYLVSVGGFLYPFIWLFAGIYGPSMGRTAAKESFVLFGYMGGVFLVGVVLTLFLVARFPLRKIIRDQAIT